jgi:hypothetical protein
LPATLFPSAASHREQWCALVFAAAFALGGCAAMPPAAGDEAAPAARPVPASAEPPAPNVNLSGFPLPYRQGYADGCASAGGSERKDAARYASDGNYRTGWIDGRAICARR